MTADNGRLASSDTACYIIYSVCNLALSLRNPPPPHDKNKVKSKAIRLTRYPPRPPRQHVRD
ncbi:MAG: hypothetical protein MJE68_13500 [Proteobacteria bacterium]|nr:hypothetical protein [Pseudomonadota bacterium]